MSSREILATLSQQLKEEFGNGFSVKNLRHKMKIADVFSGTRVVSTLSRQFGWSPLFRLSWVQNLRNMIDAVIVQSLTAQLSWTHFQRFISLKDEPSRDSFADMCRVETSQARTEPREGGEK